MDDNNNGQCLIFSNLSSMYSFNLIELNDIKSFINEQHIIKFILGYDETFIVTQKITLKSK